MFRTFCAEVLQARGARQATFPLVNQRRLNLPQRLHPLPAGVDVLGVGETAVLTGVPMKVSSEESPSLETEEDSISCKVKEGTLMSMLTKAAGVLTSAEISAANGSSSL